MRRISYLLLLLLLLPATGAPQPENRRVLRLDDYPFRLMGDNDEPLMTPLRVSPEQPSDTLHITESLSCVLTMSFQNQEVYQQDLYTLETAPADEIYDLNYGRISVLNDNETFVVADSILMVGPADYDPQNKLLLIPGIFYQSTDNLDTATYFFLVDLEAKRTYRIFAENSIQACINNDGKSVIFINRSDI